MEQMVREYDVADQQMEQQVVSRSALQLVLERVVPRFTLEFNSYDHS